MTPAECDLRGLPYMPVDTIRLFDSDFYAMANGDEFKAGFTLWGKAFMQVPAGSLPNDDRVLAHLSGAGANWCNVKEMALHGWVKCSDNRLYHKTVAEKVKDAWDARLSSRARTEAARAARHPAKVTNGATPPTSVTEHVTESVTEVVTDSVTGSKLSTSKVEVEGKEGSKAGKARARGARLPADWQSPPDCDAYAVKLGLDPAAIGEQFRDHWAASASPNSVKRDWNAAWRTWCRTEAERKAARRTNGQQQPRGKLAWAIDSIMSEARH
jgi:hypothetical protein